MDSFYNMQNDSDIDDNMPQRKWPLLPPFIKFIQKF